MKQGRANALVCLILTLSFIVGELLTLGRTSSPKLSAIFKLISPLAIKLSPSREVHDSAPVGIYYIVYF